MQLRTPSRQKNNFVLIEARAWLAIIYFLQSETLKVSSKDLFLASMIFGQNQLVPARSPSTVEPRWNGHQWAKKI